MAGNHGLEVEVTALVELRNYENIVKVFDVFMGVDGKLHLVMELCDGDLANHMCSEDNHGPLSLFDIAQQAATGLDVLHSHSPTIIHRDIKPQNILIKRNSSTHKLLVKITDFGISRHAEADIAFTDNLFGTAVYSAPEHFASMDGVGMKDGKKCISSQYSVVCVHGNTDNIIPYSNRDQRRCITVGWTVTRRIAG